MFRSRLRAHVQLLQLLSNVRQRGGCSSGSIAASSSRSGPPALRPAAASAAVPVAAASGSRRAYAAEATTDSVDASQLKQAAHELGLDVVPFGDLKAMMADALRDDPTAETVVARAPPEQTKLRYGDLPGYQAVLGALLRAPEEYGLPQAPALDAGQWVDTHFKEAGLGMEPRGDFYVWRSWAAAHLPPDQMQTMLAMEQVMSDETTRAAMVKQAQHELARLWDWQHRRAALGLTPDLPAAQQQQPRAAAAAAAGGGSSSSSDASSSATAAASDQQQQQQQQQQGTGAGESGAGGSAGPTGGQGGAAAAARRPGGAAGAALSEARAVAAALDEKEADWAHQHRMDESDAEDASGDDESGSGFARSGRGSGGRRGGMRQASRSSSSDSDSGVEEEPPAPASLLDVLALVEEEEQQQEAAAAAAAAAASAEGTVAAAEAVLAGAGSSGSGGGGAAAAAVAASLGVPLVEDVVDGAGQGLNPVVAKWARSQQARDFALRQVRDKLDRGSYTALKGKRRTMADVPLRRYNPVRHDDDIFLPVPPYGSKHVAAALANPTATRAVNPDKVTAQAAAVADAAARAGSNVPGLLGSGGLQDGVQDMACWTSMPLLDRALLREQSVRAAAERLMSRAKRQMPWQLPADGYSFDLQQRPPTPALDRLTGYLEVRYADVLLRKDAVQTAQRQQALYALQHSGSGSSSSSGSSSASLATELLEQPPAALTAAKTLSPAERAGILDTLDGLLGGGQYGSYRQAVLQLYCDGLVSWGELQECWAAAQAGEELQAAAEGPVSGLAGDRDRLFSVLSGRQQLQEMGAAGDSSSSSSPADEAAARKAWEAAGQKLQASLAAGSSSSWSGEPISYDEAAQTWQQLLHLAGQPAGPRFDQVLLAAGGGSGAVQQQLSGLQQALERATGLSASTLQAFGAATASSDGSGGVTAADFEQLQGLFGEAAPSLDQLLHQHWAKVAKEGLGQELASSPSSSDSGTPDWSQMWQLLQLLTAAASAGQGQAAGAAAADGGAVDAAALFDRYLREAAAVPLTPPPYPGARRLVRWEQRIILHAASGEAVLPAELKVRMTVSAAELAQETGLSQQGLQHLLAIAGRRYDPSTGLLGISCDRFSTREENRRWCLEALHRLLAAAQARHPSPDFWVDSRAMLGDVALAALPSAGH